MELYTLTFGERLLVLRHRAGLTKTELARRAGVSTSVITSYENDKSEPSHDIRANLASALGVTINLLILGLNDPKKEMPEKPLV